LGEKASSEQVNTMRTPPLLKPVLNSPAADYLRSLGISPEIAEEAGVCYAPRWPHWTKIDGKWKLLGVDRRIVFPYYDLSGHEQTLAAVTAFAIHSRFLRSPRLTNGQKWRGAFFFSGAFQALPLFFVQTPLDVLALATCGVPAIAVGGKEIADWILQAASLRVVCLGAHNSESGDRLVERIAQRLAAYPMECFRLRPACKTWLEELNTFNRWGLSLRLKVTLQAGIRQATRLRVCAESILQRERLSDVATLPWEQLLHHPPDPWKYHSDWKRRHLEHQGSLYAPPSLSD
jgi:hypothetical protein